MRAAETPPIGTKMRPLTGSTATECAPLVQPPFASGEHVGTFSTQAGGVELVPASTTPRTANFGPTLVLPDLYQLRDAK